MNGVTLRRLRQVHQYVGMFFAPAILFFAFSGALQTFSLHENHGGGPYRPPAWIVAIASLHKDQALPRQRPPGAGDHAQKRERQDHGPPDAPEAPRPSPLPLKIFVLALAVGLMGSTGVGVFIGLQARASRPGSLAALVLGFVLPLVLIWV
jgi:hypothetical protein